MKQLTTDKWLHSYTKIFVEAEMLIRRKWSFGLGTIFSIIIVYFIYLYSKDKGWGLLALLSKLYLIVVGGLLALSLGLFLIIILFVLMIFLITALRLKTMKKHYKRKSKDYVDIDYKIRD